MHQPTNLLINPPNPGSQDVMHFMSWLCLEQRRRVVRSTSSCVFRWISPFKNQYKPFFYDGSLFVPDMFLTFYLFITHHPLPPLSIFLLWAHIISSCHTSFPPLSVHHLPPPVFFTVFSPLFLSTSRFPSFSPTSPLGSFNLFSPRCHLFILPRCLLRFPSVLLHLWLFFLSVHRSVFLPPLGGNGKSDISYLVNGERWRERERKRETQETKQDRKMESKDQKNDIRNDCEREREKENKSRGRKSDRIKDRSMRKRERER